MNFGKFIASFILSYFSMLFFVFKLDICQPIPGSRTFMQTYHPMVNILNMLCISMCVREKKKYYVYMKNSVDLRPSLNKIQEYNYNPKIKPLHS